MLRELMVSRQATEGKKAHWCGSPVSWPIGFPVNVGDFGHPGSAWAGSAEDSPEAVRGRGAGAGSHARFLSRPSSRPPSDSEQPGSPAKIDLYSPFPIHKEKKNNVAN